GVTFDKGLYRASAESGAPLLPAAEGSRLFAVSVGGDPIEDVLAGRADIGILKDPVSAPDTSKGNAALAALKQAAKDYSFSELVLEKDQAAAFPVRVELKYEPQAKPNEAGAAPAIPTSLTAPSAPTTSGGET